MKALAKILRFAAMAAAIFLCGCAAPEELVISGGGLEVVLAPRAGGRVAGLYYEGSENLIDSVPELWREPQLPESNEWMKRFDDPRGQVFWTAPQQEWWRHQELFPAKREKSSPWPPDPYVEFGRTEVVSRDSSGAELRLEKSPVSGLGMTRIYRIEKTASGARLILHCRITNLSGASRRFGVWSVTRPRPDTQLAIAGRITGVENASLPVAGLAAADGRVLFRAEAATPGFKAMIAPEELVYELKSGGVAWQRRWAADPRGEVAPGHALAELVYSPASAGVPALLEVESHGNFAVIPPGESMNYLETWNFSRAEDAP